MKNVSKAGFTCLPWFDTIQQIGVIQSANEVVSRYPILRGASNECRNPDYDADGPWCYVRTSKI